MALWVKMFTDMNEILKNEFLNSQKFAKVNLDVVSEYMRM